MSKEESENSSIIRKQRLKEKGIENLASEILKAFEQMCPTYQEEDFPLEFCDYFLASAYGLHRNDYDSDRELATIVQTVREKVWENYHRNLREKTPGQNLSEKRINKSPTPAISSLARVNPEFKKKSVDELVKEIITYIKDMYKQNPHDAMLVNSQQRAQEMIRYAFWSFWDMHYPQLGSADGLARVKRGLVLEQLYQKWIEVCPGLEKMLSPEQFEQLKEFSEKTPEEFADEIISFFEEKAQWSALFDRSPQGRRIIFEEFWSKRFPFLNEDQLDDLRFGSRWWETKNLVLARFPEVEARVYDLVLSECLKWAKINNKKSVSSEEVGTLLKTFGLLDAPKRLMDTLRADINKRVA